jgi:hypothetical protein
MNFRSVDAQCWEQLVEANECLARDAIFVCDGNGDWDLYGCNGAGEDPSICSLSDD